MKPAQHRWKVMTALTLLGLWWGVPAIQQRQADKLVDGLCVSHGGIRVYHTVRLAEDQFNQGAPFRVPDQNDMRAADPYYSVRRTQALKGKPDSADAGALVIYQDHFLIHRSGDDKLLGEAIAFSRRGGDPLGPWPPSSHSCPEFVDVDLTRQVFQRSDS